MNKLRPLSHTLKRLAGILILGFLSDVSGVAQIISSPEAIEKEWHVTNPSEKERRREFKRLSVWPPNINKQTYEVRNMRELKALSPTIVFAYNPDTHTVRGSEIKISSTVADSKIKDELAYHVKQFNDNAIYSWEHEFKHAKNSKFIGVIKEPELLWKISFLDETSATVAEVLLFRKYMLDEYFAQIKEYEQEDNTSKIIKFSALRFKNVNNTASISIHALNTMIDWWDKSNNFEDLVFEVSQNEAAKLMFSALDDFSIFVDNPNSYYPFRNIFDKSLTNPTKFDTEDFFIEAVNALFTYKIDNKDINLFEILGQTARQTFLARLNVEMKKSYERHLAGK